MICIYHKNCQDGFVAALAVWMKYGDSCEYIEAQYGDSPPDILYGQDVIIVDFSYPRETLLKMKEQAKSLIVIDHHKTAQKDCEGLDFCIFDMEKSGAVLTWEYLFPDQLVPLLSRYAQDRDLWKWEMDGSKAVSAGLRLQKKDFREWIKFLLDENELFNLLKQGDTVLQYQDGCVKAAIGGEYDTITLDGYIVPITNCTHLISETIGALAGDQPFAVGYFDTKDRRVFNLRSKEPDGVDVAEIAKKYGGGGHKHAAGFWIKKPKIFPE
jgi:oligoribonuclease NrnB/cAMP/cGMP phosphodiesterase (DHH superfamily)